MNQGPSHYPTARKLVKKKKDFITLNSSEQIQDMVIWLEFLQTSQGIRVYVISRCDVD